MTDFSLTPLSGPTAPPVQAIVPVLRSLHRVANWHEPVSFELLAVDWTVSVGLGCPERLAQHVSAQLQAHCPGESVTETPFRQKATGAMHGASISLRCPALFLIKSDGHADGDPLAGLIAALGRVADREQTSVQVKFRPAAERAVDKTLRRTADILALDLPTGLNSALLSKPWERFRSVAAPLRWIASGFCWLLARPNGAPLSAPTPWTELITRKTAAPCFRVSITISHAGTRADADKIIAEVASTLSVYDDHIGNRFVAGPVRSVRKSWCRPSNEFLLNAIELAALVHIPTGIAVDNLVRAETRTLPPPLDLPTPKSAHDTIVGVTNHRQSRQPIVLSHEDRRRHVYILGKTGMGKTTLLETMIAADLAAWRGLALIDPHGDLAQTVVGNLPKSRINHTIIFDPSDREWPVGFNMLEAVDAERRPLVASGLVGIFKKLFHDSWGPRLEHTLRSSILALLDYPGATLLSVPLMLTNDAFRAKVVAKVTDPVVRAFWEAEFGRLNPTQRVETVSPILNKVGQFLSSPLLRNILGQPQSAFSLRRAMDQGKTVIVNLSKGKLGEDASSLLGAMLVTRFQLDAMSRADMPERERRDFTLYVDEFQNFATESFATILSEARKYRLSLVMANQYVGQMPEPMREAVFGNVGSLISFQVGPSDAPVIRQALHGDVTETDLINMRKHTAIMRLSIDGMPTRPFSADMVPPVPRNAEAMAHRYAKVLEVTRTKYANPRAFVVEKIERLLTDARRADETDRTRRRKRS